MIRETDCLALCDFETTGVDTEKDLPIEVGILFCDRELQPLAAVDRLIKPTPDWSPADAGMNYFAAARIHGIMPDELMEMGKTYIEVAGEIHDACKRVKRLRKRRIILLSHNAQFEYRFMQRTLTMGLPDASFPFHYCAWDSSLFLKATGIGDLTPVHRAMPDVGRLHGALLKAWRRL